MTSTKKKEVDKCEAAVEIKTRAEVNDIVIDGKAVFSIAKGKTRVHFKRCTKGKHEDSKTFCKIHAENSLHGGNVLTFEEVMKNDTALKVNRDKLLEAKTKSDDDPNPVFRIIVSNDIKKSFKDIIQRRNEKPAKKQDDKKTTDKKEEKVKVEKEEEVKVEEEVKEEDEKEDDTKEEDNEEEKQSDNEVANDDNDKEEKQSSDKEDNEEATSDKEEDEGMEVDELLTKKGEKLGLDKDTQTVYREDSSDGQSEEIGKLYEVKEKDAPISHEGKQCIVGKEYEEKNVKYMRCVLSNKLYSVEKSGALKLAGTIKKDGSKFKITLNNRK